MAERADPARFPFFLQHLAVFLHAVHTTNAGKERIPGGFAFERLFTCRAAIIPICLFFEDLVQEYLGVHFLLIVMDRNPLTAFFKPRNG